MARRSYEWFGRRRRTKALDLAQQQITKALDTVTLLHQTIQQVSEAKKKEATQSLERLFMIEEEVDNLRTEVFKEVSTGAALFSEYREDLIHLVTRLDTLADHVQDAARCVKILEDSKVPNELWKKMVHMTATLEDCATTLRNSIEKIAVNPTAAIESAQKVDKIESEVDKDYLEIKSLLISYAEQMNYGSMIIFDHLVEFIEQAADMCADTADYIATFLPFKLYHLS